MREGEILAGKYRLVRQLGKGGEGSVYLAIHLQTEMFWAIKEIRLQQGADREDCCHELQMMKSLKMRHLPQIIDVLRTSDSVCLVMEHVRGVSLEDRIRGGKVLSYEEVRDTAEQVTETLCYLESREKPVCHLDIKPSNLIRRPDGLIKLVDFGSAWKEKEQMKRMGTDGYAAPEQYRKDTKPDVRTDLYALGATLYRLLAGKTWNPVTDEGCVPNCPPQMSDLIRRCLRADPSERFQSADALRRELVRIRKKEGRERGRVHILGALAMALPAAALCLRILPSTLDLSADESWDYEKLVREAGVVSEEEGRAYYQKAVFLDPGRSEAYLKYLDEAGQDGIFSEEEETFLRETLHAVRPGSDQTYEELLRKNGEAYARAALQIGLSYWYCSPREDSRRIAMGWFEKAAEAAREAEAGSAKEYSRKAAGQAGETLPVDKADGLKALAEDREKAERYLRLGAVWEKINSPSGEDAPWNAQEYWEDLGEILSEDKAFLQEDPLMQMKLSLEALRTITFLSGDLMRSGIDSRQINRRIRELLEGCTEVEVPPARQVVCRGLLEEIREASAAAIQAVEHQEEEQKPGQTEF